MAHAPSNAFEAAQLGDIKWLVTNLERNMNMNVNAVDKIGRTALMWAVDSQQPKMVQILLDYGAEIDVKECNGRTAIHLAAMKGFSDILQLLILELPEVAQELFTSQPDNFGMTPAFLAHERGPQAHDAHSLLLHYCKKDYSITSRKGSAATATAAVA